MKGEVLTSVLQNGGWSASMKVLCKVQVLFFKWSFVLKIRHFAKPRTVDTKLLAIFTIKSCLKLKIKNHRFFASNFANGICERQFFQANRLKSSIKLHKIMQKVNRINEWWLFNFWQLNELKTSQIGDLQNVQYVFYQ